MMHPELMEIVARSHQEYLRSLARGDSFTNDVRYLTRSLLHALGSGMVRTGGSVRSDCPSAGPSRA